MAGLKTSQKAIEQAVNENVFYAIGLGAMSTFLFLIMISLEYRRFRGNIQTK